MMKRQPGTIGYEVAKEITGLASEGEHVSLSDRRKQKSALPWLMRLRR